MRRLLYTIGINIHPFGKWLLVITVNKTILLFWFRNRTLSTNERMRSGRFILPTIQEEIER